MLIYGIIASMTYLIISSSSLIASYSNFNSKGKGFWNKFTFLLYSLIIIATAIIISLSYKFNFMDVGITCAVSLFAALTTLLGVIYSNFKADKNKYIELRFNDTKTAINYLIPFIQSTISVYNDIKNVSENSGILSSFGFLIMQFTSIVVNTDLLSKMPYNLRFMIEKREWDEKHKKTIIKTAINELKLIKQTDLHENTKNIIHYSDYVKFIDNFKNLEKKELSYIVFYTLYSSDIKENEFLDHFISILDEITSNRIEEIILKDQKIKLDVSEYRKLLKKYLEEEN